MHVLIIPSETYLPKESFLSGIFQQDQAHALRRAGYKIGIITTHFYPLPVREILKVFDGSAGVEIADDSGIPVLRYHFHSLIPRNDEAYMRVWLKCGMTLLKKYIARYGIPDVIHAHNALYAGMLAHDIKKTYGIRFVITEHHSDYAMGLIPEFALPRIKDAIGAASALIVVSPQLGAVMKETFGTLIRSLVYVPNLLSPIFETLELNRTENRNGKSSVRFLSIGGLDAIKGHKYLLEAFSEKFGGNKDIQLRIGGDGPIRKELEAYAIEKGIKEQTVFLGWLDREGVRNEMTACDIFVLPSFYETFGVVLIEALACGKPVIATRSGGPQSIVNEHNGILVPPKDADALAEAMDYVLNRLAGYDGRFIREDCISRFGEKAVVAGLAGVYERIPARL